MLTSSLAYITATEIKYNKEVISSNLRNYKNIIENGNEPTINLPNKVSYVDRSSIRETFADVWNFEIIKGVNWVYTIDWFAGGDKIEKKLRQWLEVSEK